jgi:integrase
VKLTKHSVAELLLPPGKIDHTAWDDELPGFGLRLRKSKGGVSKSYRIQYRVGSQQRSKHLDARKVKLEDARKVARQFFAQAHLGVDPAAEKAKERIAAAAAKLTLASIADRYLAVKRQALLAGTYSASTYEATVRYFNVHWAPLRGRPIDGIKRPEVAARLQELTAEYGRSAAGKARYTLSALYTWAMGEGLCEANPVVATNNPEAGAMPRERVLSDAELKAVLGACADDDAGNIVKLLAFTGCRREEIAALRWDEIDLETGTLTLPATRTKNRRTLTLTLPEAAQQILRSVPRRDGPCVFGDPRHGFNSWSGAKRKLDARIAVAGARLPHWTVHDLRRTMRTGLGRLGVAPHIAELAINHVKAGIVAVYDRYRYEQEIADALAQWAEHVMAVVEGRRRKPPERKRARLASVTN